MTTTPPGTMGKLMFGPRDSLSAMFRTCSRDPTEAVNTRLRRMHHTFMQHHRSNAGSEKNKTLVKCCCEAERWYYKILENLLEQERKRPDFRGFSGILENELFHCCLVVCCLEITMFTNHLPCDFTLLLNIFNLTPYNFWKVIEPVLRAGVVLPLTVVSHLGKVEERVVEGLAWSGDSPLWQETRANECRLPTCQQVMPPKQLEDPSGATLQPDQNLPGAEVSLESLTVDRPQTSSTLYIFTRKVYSLKAERLRKMCSLLDVPDELRLKIWTCFEYSLVHCTDLMVDRHLDQLLLCALYIMPKITRFELPFKQILNCYKSLPNINKSVCKKVLISSGDAENAPTENNQSSSLPTPNTPSTHYPGTHQGNRANLIDFYNQIYSSRMENFAKQFESNAATRLLGDTPPLSPYPKQHIATPLRHRLSDNHNIYLSMHNTETTPPPASGLLYIFNSSPSERLREINNMIRSSSLLNRRGYAVSLDEGEEEDGDGGPSAKRPRTDGQSAWQRKLREVINDRNQRNNPD
ncbi:retinoblastoma-like protein 2 isoform X1 [Sphaeramia orbicularis]|uniref:retinoblastoma-like protein 2 isoform X1 n=1 Tax=Sphaeramia orbicularis TaxID=375764 RepID=UPI00117E7C39|nr:retinoblastoma-like protein 2 isoform X1 [Sphaeramia orbicularis]XP_030016270.1 retinoblastoma-like protein 2 isoform X1 [Sphaeramia orbicularis]